MATTYAAGTLASIAFYLQKLVCKFRKYTAKARLFPFFSTNISMPLIMENKHILKQKRLFINSTIYTITEEGLLVKESSLFKSIEYFFRFENLGVKFIKSKAGKTGWAIAAGAFLLVAISVFIAKVSGEDVEQNAHLFYLSFSLACALIFILSYKNAFYLATNDNKNAVQFLFNNPSKIDVDNFISELKTQRKRVLLIRYGQIDKLIPYEQQHSQFVWLLENEALTNDEFQNKVDELKQAFSTRHQITGFKI